MATNKIDYEALERAATNYENQATALADMVAKLDSTNATLAEGWQNETARAFIERYECEHKRALQSAGEALRNISAYIKKYSENERERDRSGANSVRG